MRKVILSPKATEDLRNINAYTRIAKNKIEILGIPHQSMDVSSHFVENDFPKATK